MDFQEDLVHFQPKHCHTFDQRTSAACMNVNYLRCDKIAGNLCPETQTMLGPNACTKEYSIECEWVTGKKNARQAKHPHRAVWRQPLPYEPGEVQSGLREAEGGTLAAYPSDIPKSGICRTSGRLL